MRGGTTHFVAPHHSIDRAKKPGMELHELNRFLEDMDQQPGWRYRADREVEYYDSNQLNPMELADLEARGLPPVVVNLIAPTVNVVLGLEAKTRTDWLVRPEEEADREVAEALNVKLKKVAQKTHAQRACGDAYAKQVKVGIGWVEVSRHWNPLKFPYRVASVDHREIWWDWRAKEPDLSDARYLVRKKWYDVDQVEALFPQHADLIRLAGNGWAEWDPTNYAPHQYFLQDNFYERDWGWDEAEWRDVVRQRVCLYEVWYRIFVRCHVIVLPNGRKVEYDRQNPMHVAAVLSNRVRVQPAVLPKMRLAWWMGPHRFSDQPSPLPHDGFPYVPFWGYREDLTGIPYGIIRNMMPLQDEVNRRRAKMLWQLSARRVYVEEDAVKDHDAVMREIARPDTYVKLNKDRKNRSWAGIKVEDNTGLNAQQFDAYQDSKKGIQDVSGVFQEMLGKQGDAESGIAIQTLIEQGTTTLAELNDNYRFARQQVGEQLLAFIIEDMAGKPEQVKVDQGHGQGLKTVTLNQPRRDERTGLMIRDNDVTRTLLRVELDSIQATATYRTQVFLRLTDMVKALPANLQALILDMVFEASDFPGKDEIAERIRKATGVVPRDPKTMDESERKELAARAQKMQEMEAIERQRVMLEIEDMAAELRQKNADVFKTEQEGRHEAAEADKAEAEADAQRLQAGLPPEDEGTDPGPMESMAGFTPIGPGEDEGRPYQEPNPTPDDRVNLYER